MSDRHLESDPIDSYETEGLSCPGQTLGLVKESIKIGEEDDGNRVDIVISRSLGLSRSFVQRLIKDGLVNLTTSNRTKSSYKVKTGDQLIVQIPPPRPLDIIPEPVDFSLVYEDKHIIVLDKPAGLVVHPSPGHWRGTLVHGLLHRFPDIGSINDVVRPGIVHRLDSTTSGLMVIARDVESLHSLQISFQERLVDKIYLALACGRVISDKISVRVPIGRDYKNRYRMAVDPDGKDSWTDVEPLWDIPPYSFISCRLHTGRTHQIRVHLRHLGAPLVGDTLYGFKRARQGKVEKILGDRVFLHAWRLSFPHPVTGEKMSFRSTLPSDLISSLKELLSRKGGL